MALFRHEPTEAAAMRAAIFSGDVFQLPPTDASLAFVESARAVLREELEADDVRTAPLALPSDDFFARIGRARRRIFCEPRHHDAVRAVIAAYGFDPAHCAFDPARLRVVRHRGHDDPRAAAVYHAHRDTWYAHPRQIVAWWIPLDDLDDEETFVFHPRAFDVAVANDSEVFDYDAWVREGWSLKIGWQDRDAGLRATYPRLLEAPPPPAIGFACRRGENVLFSGAHLHRTLPQSLHRIRYSLDFRAVDVRDEAAGIGAPNVDGRSRGSAFVDYVQPKKAMRAGEAR